MDYKKIGKFIQELRKEKGWTQEDLASKLSTVRETVSKWERGLYIPNIEVLLILQDLFNVTINEILYGERKNEKNDEQIDAIPIEIMKEGKRKVRKIFIVSGIIIILLIITFLAYYFINTYNSISIYKISGNTETISLNDGVMIISKEKSYIQLGNIDNHYTNNIEKVRLYYVKNNKEHDIFNDSGTKVNYLLINDFNYNELFKYSDIKYIRNDLYLEITFSDETKEILKLELIKDFSNNILFSKNNSNDPKTIDSLEKNHNTISEYILNNFKLDNENKEYYLDTTIDSKRINQKYSIEANLYVVEEINDNKIYHYDYFINDGSLMYYDLNNEIMENEFTYDIIKEQCIYENCNLEIINYFKKNYLNKMDFN